MTRRTRLAAAVSVVLAVATLAGHVNPQTPDAEMLDFAQAAQWAGAPKRLPRESRTQLMMIDRLNVDVPGQRRARADPVPPTIRGFFAEIWSALARGRLASLFTELSSTRPVIWLDPLGGGGGGGGQGVTRATRVHAYLTSLGNSTGEAFDIEIVNDGPEPVRLDGDGVVVEPIKAGSDKTLRAELRQVADRPSGAVTSRANAYCLEFKLKAPERGGMFEVSDAATQQQFAPAREILRASRRLQDAGGLMPDSDPTEYFHTVRQWAIWVNEQRFTLPSYRTAFIERTKKNAEAVGRKWTKDLENVVNSVVPHRWDEIRKILREARQPVPGA